MAEMSTGLVIQEWSKVNRLP